MRKRMIIMIIALIIVFGGLVAYNMFRAYMIKKYFAEFQPPPQYISTAFVKKQNWTPTIEAVGSIVAINGVSVTSEINGLVTSINFNSGQMVHKGELLVQLDDSVQQANLQRDQAQVTITKLTMGRYQKLYKQQAISEQDRDQSVANYQQAVANVAQDLAYISQKHITAPFDGKVGIRQVNLGQFINPGDPLVSLQSMDPLYVNFSIPEQFLPALYLDQTIELIVDSYPKQTFTAKINAINSTIDTQTHNISVQATVPNHDLRLYPGLFANIKILMKQEENVIVVPQTAVTTSLFGDSVYVVVEDGKDKNGKTILRVRRDYVSLGAQFGNQIIITKGLNVGDQVVTSGQLKLDNNMQVEINNVVNP